MELSLGDVAAVVIYFLLIIGIGVWVSYFVENISSLVLLNVLLIFSVNDETQQRYSWGLLFSWEIYVLAASELRDIKVLTILKIY